MKMSVNTTDQVMTRDRSSDQNSTLVGIVDPVGRKAGMDSYDIPLAEGLVEHGYEVVVYSNFEADSDQVGVRYSNLFSLSKFSSLSGAIKYIISMFKACKLHSKNEGDWVILHYFNANVLTFLSFLIPRLFSLKTIGIIHDVESFGADDKKIFQRLILNRLANIICVQNTLIREKVLPLLSSEKNHSVFEAPHGSYESVISDIKEKNSVRDELGIPHDKTVVLFFGQIKKVKGLELFLESANQLSDDYFFIVAGNPWKDSLDRYAQLLESLKARGNSVLDLQYVSNESRHDYFCASDVLVLPYHEIYESGVMHMGMSYGLPIIASDLPLFEQRINESRAGVCFKKGDSSDLTLTLETLGADKQLIVQMGINSKQYSQTHFNWSNIAKSYADAIRSANK